MNRRIEALKLLANEYQKQCHFGLGGCACAELGTRLNVEECLMLFWQKFDREFGVE